jgi:hypothetical protein
MTSSCASPARERIRRKPCFRIAQSGASQRWVPKRSLETRFEKTRMVLPEFQCPRNSGAVGVRPFHAGCAFPPRSAQVLDDTNRQRVRVQFGLIRLFQCTIIVAAISALFAAFKWPLALLILCGLNAAASVYFCATRRARIAGPAFITSCLILATLFFTDWGFSSPNPRVRIAWPYLVAACLSQLWAVFCWLISAPRVAKRTSRCLDGGNHER